MVGTSLSSNSTDLVKEIQAFGEISLDTEGPSPVQVRSVSWGKLLRPCSQGSKSAAVDLKALGEISWSELPLELVIEILQRLQSYQDFLCFASACSSWRLIGTGDKFAGGYQFPWLMLAEEEGSNLRGFYNVRKNMTCYLELPEANGRKQCVCSLGWLVTVDTRLEINLLHPLSRIQIKLPHVSTLDPLDREGFRRDPVLMYDLVVTKAALSSSPGKTSDYSVGILFANGRVAMWRSREASWTVLEHAGNSFKDIVFYRGRFYATRRSGAIYAWDIEGTRTELVAELPEGSVEYPEKMYLVESGGALLMVSRSGVQVDDDDNYGTYKFQVFEVSWRRTDKSWKQVSNLGSRALFLGFNSSFSIEASNFPGCKQNCIYFTDDCVEGYIESPEGGGKDMGIYCLENGLFEPRFPVHSFAHISPPMWVELTI